MRGLPLGCDGQGFLKHGMVKRGPLDSGWWMSDMQKVRSMTVVCTRDVEDDGLWR